MARGADLMSIMAPEPPGGMSDKLSPQARRLMAERAADEGAAGPVDLLIRTTDLAEGEARARLEAIGVRVRTVAGDVCSASADVAVLGRLAQLDHVVSIEVAGDLWPERPPGG